MTSTYRRETCRCTHGKVIHQVRRINKKKFRVLCRHPGCKCPGYDPLPASELAKEPQKRVENTLPSHLSLPAEDEGLTVKINLWPLDKSPENTKPGLPRLWTKGQVIDTETGEAKIFNGAGALLSILGKWKLAKQKKSRDNI